MEDRQSILLQSIDPTFELNVRSMKRIILLFVNFQLVSRENGRENFPENKKKYIERAREYGFSIKIILFLIRELMTEWRSFIFPFYCFSSSLIKLYGSDNARFPLLS